MTEVGETIISPVETKEKKAVSSPKVEYHSSLKEESVPYTVRINERRFGELLDELGLSAKKIEETKIIVRTEAPVTSEGLRVVGSLAWYNPKTGDITLHTDRIWRNYEILQNIAEEIISGEVQPEDDQFEKLLVTKRLSKYLAEAPPERAEKFAQKILWSGIKRSFINALQHEGIHAADSEKKLLQVLDVSFHTGLLLGVVGAPFAISIARVMESEDPSLGIHHVVASYLGFVTLGTIAESIYYKYSPVEKRARKISKKLLREEKWKDLITVDYKNSTHPLQ